MVHAARSSVGSSAAASSFPRFEVHADRSPQVLARVIGLFAAQAIVPVELYARHSAAGLWLALHADVDPALAERLAEKMRSFVAVEAVILVPAAVAVAPVVAMGEPVFA
jgi:hypothetical protein